MFTIRAKSWTVSLFCLEIEFTLPTPVSMLHSIAESTPVQCGSRHWKWGAGKSLINTPEWSNTFGPDCSILFWVYVRIVILDFDKVEVFVNLFVIQLVQCPFKKEKKKTSHFPFICFISFWLKLGKKFISWKFGSDTPLGSKLAEM